MAGRISLPELEGRGYVFAAIGAYHAVCMFGLIENDDGAARLQDLKSERRVCLAWHAGRSAMSLRIVEDVVVAEIIPFG